MPTVVDIPPDGVVVAEHARCFRARARRDFRPFGVADGIRLGADGSPCADGTPFQGWALPSAMDRVQREIEGGRGTAIARWWRSSAVCGTASMRWRRASVSGRRFDPAFASGCVYDILVAGRRDRAPAVAVLTPDTLVQPQAGKPVRRYDGLGAASSNVRRFWI